MVNVKVPHPTHYTKQPQIIDDQVLLTKTMPGRLNIGGMKHGAASSITSFNLLTNMSVCSPLWWSVEPNPAPNCDLIKQYKSRINCSILPGRLCLRFEDLSSLSSSHGTGWGSGSVRPCSIGSSMDYRLCVWNVSLTVTWPHISSPFCSFALLSAMVPKSSVQFTDRCMKQCTHKTKVITDCSYLYLCVCVYAFQHKRGDTKSRLGTGLFFHYLSSPVAGLWTNLCISDSSQSS